MRRNEWIVGCPTLIPRILLTMLSVWGISCQRSVSDDELVAKKVLSRLRERDQFARLTEKGLEVRRATEFDSVLTGTIYEVETITFKPPYFYYVLQKGESLYILPSGPDSMAPSPKLLEFANYRYLARTGEVAPLAHVYLKVLSNNYCDSIISSIEDIPGARLSFMNGDQFLTTVAGETVSVRSLNVRALNCSRDTLDGKATLRLEFNSYSPYSGDLYFDQIILRRDSTYSCRRDLICHRIVRGRMID